ncbi:type II toxin-antitoxin system Phd/YefM family antitoxin [Treponema socranskii]|uniref:type II toxin-antitoxin system Phd/YefM family antitoxin n=1 Tax=Treponema socranskii TaxID=53419 RepID=UPI003D6DC439
MITPMTITEAGKKITSLEHTMDYDDTIAITNHGREVFALIKWDTYESIRETLEILSDEELSEQLAVGIRQINQNKLVDFDSFKQKLLCTR